MEIFRKITVIGMGLIGGSMALALKRVNYGAWIVGYDLSIDSLESALRAGAIDQIAKSIQEAVRDSELVVLAVPVGHYGAIMRAMAPHLGKGVIVTDVGSVKGHVCQLAADILPETAVFIGGHPMAGSEQGGFTAATPTLFENAYYFVTPQNNTSEDGLSRLRDLIQAMGAYPIPLKGAEHDKIAATISHIPHLAAVILVGLLESDERLSYQSFVGGGFRDTTRIASGSPEMWKDIFLYNRKEMLRGIQKLEQGIGEIKGYLEEKDEFNILRLLKNAKNTRDQIPHRLPDYIVPLYDIVIDLEDRPGAIGELTQLLGDNNINIKEIEVLHVREGERGAIRVGLETLEGEKQALELLKRRSFSLMKTERSRK